MKNIRAPSPGFCFPQWTTSCLWVDNRQNLKAYSSPVIPDLQLVLKGIVPLNRGRPPMRMTGAPDLRSQDPKPAHLFSCLLHPANFSFSPMLPWIASEKRMGARVTASSSSDAAEDYGGRAGGICRHCSNSKGNTTFIVALSPPPF